MSSTATVPATQAPTERSMWTSRLGSLLGFLPLGVWTVNHLWDNLAAFNGAEDWERSVTHFNSPVAQALTMAFVLLPLLGHTVWGIRRLFTFRPNLGRYPTYDNSKYILQRLAGLGLLGFLGAHLWLALIQPRVFKGHPETFADIAAHMRHHPPTLIVYILGVLGVSYHLANGLSSLCFRFGIVSGRRAERNLEWVVYAFFALLMLLGFAAIYALWDAGAAFPVPDEG